MRAPRSLLIAVPVLAVALIVSRPSPYVGPPPDGIPAIDDPQFVSAEDADLDQGDPVIGFVHDGEARAYPHRVVVLHEIVNDEVAGLPVSITYCPLTATSLGFKRGDTTLGVSGQLLNSNLVMYDRGSRSS